MLQSSVSNASLYFSVNLKEHISDILKNFEHIYAKRNGSIYNLIHSKTKHIFAQSNFSSSEKLLLFAYKFGYVHKKLTISSKLSLSLAREIISVHILVRYCLQPSVRTTEILHDYTSFLFISFWYTFIIFLSYLFCHYSPVLESVSLS